MCHVAISVTSMSFVHMVSLYVYEFAPQLLDIRSFEHSQSIQHWCAAPTRANHLWRLSTLYPCEDTASRAGGGTNEVTVENVSIR